MKQYTVDEFANELKSRYPEYQSTLNAELVNKVLLKKPELKQYIQFSVMPTIGPKTYTVDEFATELKAKYPQHAALDNTELVNKAIAKKPELKNVIKFETPAVSEPPYIPEGVTPPAPVEEKTSTGITRGFEGPAPTESPAERFKITPATAVPEKTATITDPLLEEKYRAVAEAEGPVTAGAKEAALALTYSKSPVSKYRKEEHPIAATVGEITGTVAPMLAGGTGVIKTMTSIPRLATLAKAGKAGQVAFNALGRVTTAAVDYIARHNDELLSEDENVKADAKKNLAINLAAATASPLPETFLPKNLIQPFAQGATDLLVEVIGQRLAGESAFDEKNLVNTITSTLMGSLFGVADVKGLDVKTKGIVNKLKGAANKETLALAEMPVKIEPGTEMSKERSDQLTVLIRKAIEESQTPAKSKVIEPEAPKFKTEEAVEGIPVTRNIPEPYKPIEEVEAASAELKRLDQPELLGEAMLPERKRGIFSEVGAVGGKKQVSLPDVEGTAKKVERIFDEQDNAVRKIFNKSVKERARNAIDFLGEKFVDRVYYAKRLLGKTPEAQSVIGKINASKGSSAEAKMQYDKAEKVITKNLPYELENITNRYIEAKRISEIEAVKGEGEVRHTGGMTKEDADAFITEIETKLPKEQSAAIRIAANRYWKEMRNQLTQLRDNGLISDDLFNTLSEQGQYYSPRKFLQHIDPERSITTPQGKKISVRDSGIKRLAKGSEQAMVNNWRLLLSDVISRTQTRIFRNKASSALGDFVANNPDNSFGARIETGELGKLPRGMERIFFMKDGKSNAVLVPEKFAESWNQNDAIMNQSLAQFLNIASGAAIVKPFATGVFAPEFALSNIPRDMALQWLSTSEYSKIAPVAVIQNLNNFRKVFKDAWTGKGKYADYVKQGGGMEFLNEQGSFFVKDPTKTITPNIERNKQIFKAFSKLQEFSERLTRLALRDQAIKNGKTPKQATKIAREYLDFSQGGSWIKALNNAIPYLNASTQGARSVVRGAKDNPIAFSLKATQLIMMGGALAYTANRFRKREWDKIGDREKVNRWNFPLGKTYKNQAGEDVHPYLSIPKDQSSRIFATIGETIAERQMGVIDGETAWKRISMAFEDMSPIDALGLLPPSLSAIVGYSMNKNFWRRDDIWKGREVSPYMEFYEGKTPEIYKDVAANLDKVGIKLSPERLNQSLQQVLPANPLTALMGGAYESVTSSLSKKDQLALNKNVMESFSKLPGVRKYLRTTYPSKTDYKKMVDKMRDYGISRVDSEGNVKSDAMIRNEIKRKELRVNNVRQRHDREANIISEMLTSGKNDAAQLWEELREKSKTELGGLETKRINKRIKDRIKRNKTRNVYRTILYKEKFQPITRKPKYIIPER